MLITVHFVTGHFLLLPGVRPDAEDIVGRQGRDPSWLEIPVRHNTYYERRFVDYKPTVRCILKYIPSLFDNNNKLFYICNILFIFDRVACNNKIIHELD